MYIKLLYEITGNNFSYYTVIYYPVIYFVVNMYITTELSKYMLPFSNTYRNMLIVTFHRIYKLITVYAIMLY